MHERSWIEIWGTHCINPDDVDFPSYLCWCLVSTSNGQRDLVEVINIAKYNRGYRFLLTVVDVLSKHAWVQTVKSKTGKAVTDAFEKILKGRRKPVNLQTDDGKEFYNKTFQDLMKRKRIHHFSTSGDTKASVVEDLIAP